MKKLHFILIMLFIGLQAGMAQNNDSPTARQETQTEKVKVFPNPATNVVNILGLQNSARADIVVSDLYGNVVLKHRWEIKNKALNIPISNLEAGIYMVAIRSQEQNLKIKFYKK